MLSFAAASVDVVGYLSTYHMFTAHMTGNTIHLGNGLFNGKGAEAALAQWSWFCSSVALSWGAF